MTGTEATPGGRQQVRRGQDAPAGPDAYAAVAARTDPARWRPRLRAGVERADLATRDGSHETFVASPSGHVLRLRAAEGDLVAALDGSATLAELAAGTLGGAPDRLGLPAVLDLVTALQADGFLDAPAVDVDDAILRATAPGVARRRATAERTGGPTLEWSSADPVVREVHHRLTRWVFTPAGVLLTVAVALAGLAATVHILLDPSRPLQTSVPAREVALVLLLDLVLITIHEYGHAAALVHHGRRVRSAGLGLHYGSPVFFIDSSDALLLDRRARMVQSAAGPWFEATATGVVALTFLLHPDMPGGDIVHRFLILNAFALFLNLLPLLELDGYWILSDWLRIPDLRARAMAYLRRGLWQDLRARRRPTGGRAALATYAVVGGLATVAALGTSVFFWERVFGDLVRQMWSTGIGGVAGLVVLAVVVANPLLRAGVRTVLALHTEVRHHLRARRFRAERPWRVEAATLLDATGLFGDVPGPVLSELAGRVTLARFGTGEALVAQGERAEACWLIRRGTVEVLDEAPGGAGFIRRLERGACVGELGLLTGSPRSATVRAAGPVEAFRIDRSTFERLLAARACIPEGYRATAAEIAELRALGPFSALGVDDLLLLVEHGTWVHVPPGTDVVTQGEAGDAYYAIESGRLDVLEDGRAVNRLGPGDGFGERALLGSGRRTATVTARTPSRLFRIDRPAFDRVLAHGLRSGASPSRIPTARAH